LHRKGNLTTGLMLPLVSAVVPTRNRTDLVCRAVRSALDQTYPHLEVVVVVDGPDPATVAALGVMGDRRVRVVHLAQNVGGSEARNIGAREARGKWIALLDDDDEWMNRKVQCQLEAILNQSPNVVFSATAYLDKKRSGVTRQPRRFPLPVEPISNYIFSELDAYGRRDCFMQTSTWIISRKYLLAHPFTSGLKKNQDTDWLLRFFPADPAHRAFVDEPLAIFHREPNIQRISTTRDWRQTYDWAAVNRGLFTARSFAYLLMTECCRSASRQKESLSMIRFFWSQCDRRERYRAKLLFCALIAFAHNAALSVSRGFQSITGVN
jgi:glycosyltransferase involved in cell wall biosynthesis